MVKWIDLESEGCLLINIDIGEVLEDLLERGLADSVLLDASLLLKGLNLAKQIADGLVLSRDAKFVEITALLDHLDLREITSQIKYELETVGLNEAVAEKGRESDLAAVQV